MARKIYINCRFLTQRISGVQRFAFELCKQLDQLLLDQPTLEVIGLLPSRPLHGQYQNYRFQRIKLQACGRLTGHLWEQVELPWYSHQALLINLCNTASVVKKQQVITLHDAIFMTNIDSQKFWFKAWYRLMARISSARARQVFTVSQFSKKEINRLLGVALNRIAVLGNAPSLQGCMPEPVILAKYQLAAKGYFLMIGSNSARKNTQMVADLFATNSALASIPLVIAGGHYANLGAVAEINANNVHYTGYISDGELRCLYQQARALIFPSKYEGFGIPLVEAMAEETPLICADIPVCHEVCHAAALYFPVSDQLALLKHILALSEEPQLVYQLVMAGQLQLEQYNWQRFAKIMLDFILA